jgi:hypothetical protein
MNGFPNDISEIITKAGSKKLSEYSSIYGNLADSGSPIAWIPNIIRTSEIDELTMVLERNFAPYLVRSDQRIPTGLMKRMKRNHAEVMPHIRLQSTVLFDPNEKKARVNSVLSGFDAFCRSASMHAIAEDVSGFKLKRRASYQLIAYDSGDYVGPHNDHHPESPNLLGGYVDVQLTLSTRNVQSQLLLWEKEGHLNQWVDVGIRSALAVCHLPFWHQVTPLRALNCTAPSARRWLIAVTFEKRMPKSTMLH